MTDTQEEKYLTDEQFYDGTPQYYSEPLGEFANKQGKSMARVVYDPVHSNPDFSDARAGRGKCFAKWILSEKPNRSENILTTKFHIMMDSTVEPNAAIGLHHHPHSEEIYYILEGEIEMTTVTPDGREHTELLKAGDAHFLKLHQGHYGVAGPKGVRFIAVAVRP